MSNFAVLSYVNEASASNSAIRDWEIGSHKSMIGSNTGLGKNKHVFVLVQDGDEDLVGYCGQNGEQVADEQPWLDYGGRQWNFIYKVNTHTLLGKLKETCRDAGVDPKIFKQTKQFKFPRSAFKEDFQKFFDFFCQKGVIS